MLYLKAVNDELREHVQYADKQRRVDDRFNSEVEFWNDIYKKESVLSYILRQRQAMALQFVDALSLPNGSRALEVGCGAGLLAISLAKKGFTVNAVDHAMAMVERTKKLIMQKKF